MTLGLGEHASMVNTVLQFLMQCFRKIYHEDPGLVIRGGGLEARDCLIDCQADLVRN